MNLPSLLLVVMKIKNCPPPWLLATVVFLCKMQFTTNSVFSVSSSARTAFNEPFWEFEISGDRNYQFVIE